MNAFVLDSSVAIAWCFEDEAKPETDALLGNLKQAQALAPALWCWEVANVMVQGVRRGRITAADMQARFDFLADLPIIIDADAQLQAWSATATLARAEGLTAYDAAYLELALRKNVPLATADNALRAAAQKAGVVCLP